MNDNFLRFNARDSNFLPLSILDNNDPVSPLWVSKDRLPNRFSW